jgi:hypothetical protein
VIWYFPKVLPTREAAVVTFFSLPAKRMHLSLPVVKPAVADSASPVSGKLAIAGTQQCWMPAH